MTVTVVVHSLILLLAIIPFIVQQSAQEYEQAIVINFEDPSSSSSSRASASSASSRAARPTVAMAKVNPSPLTKQVEVPKSMPVITSPQPEIEIPPPSNTYFDQPVDISEPVETDAVQEIVEEIPDPDPSADFAEWAVADSEETSGEPSPLPSDTDGDGDADSGSGEGFFEGEFAGEAESGDDPFADGFFSGDWPDGDGTEGKNIGVGKAGDGQYWGDFAGDGLFNRKVIQRANVARLALKEGKLVVNLCVDKSGKVVFVECDRKKSTIRDDKLMSMAEGCASHYIFDQDPTAPEKQCGRLTFIFKIDGE